MVHHLLLLVVVHEREQCDILILSIVLNAATGTARGRSICMRPLSAKREVDLKESHHNRAKFHTITLYTHKEFP